MLAVDIGNTFTRIVSFAGATISRRMSFHSRDLDLDELTRAFQTLAREKGEPVWVSSVAPPVNALVDSAAEHAGLRRHFIRSDVDFIIPHTLSTPWSTGVDRLLSAYAAGVLHYSRAAGKGYVVMQCGSAATIDLVDGDGIFKGGYILPGPTFWLLGLSVGVQLPNLASEIPDWREVTVGDNTRDAMLHGMQLGLPLAAASAAMLITAKDGNHGENLPVIITGGWGEAVIPYLRSPHVYDPDLLLQGIRLFGERDGLEYGMGG